MIPVAIRNSDAVKVTCRGMFALKIDRLVSPRHPFPLFSCQTSTGLNPIDFFIVVGSLIATIVLGWKVSHGASKKAGDFLVGGRKLGWLLQFFLNFGNMADSNGAPSVSAEVYREGVGGAWINFQLLFSTPFYWFFPVWFRRSRQVTFADLFIDRFNDRKLASVYAILASIFVFGIIVMGNVISFKVASAMILKPSSAWTATERESVDQFHEYEALKLKQGTSLWTPADTQRYERLDALYQHSELNSYISYLHPATFYIVYTLIVGFYIVLGGLKAAAIIDAFQGILIIILSFMMIPMGLHAVGGFVGLHDKVDASKFQLFGVGSGQPIHLVFDSRHHLHLDRGLHRRRQHGARRGLGQKRARAAHGHCHGGIRQTDRDHRVAFLRPARPRHFSPRQWFVRHAKYLGRPGPDAPHAGADGPDDFRHDPGPHARRRGRRGQPGRAVHPQHVRNDFSRSLRRALSRREQNLHPAGPRAEHSGQPCPDRFHRHPLPSSSPLARSWARPASCSTFGASSPPRPLWLG